MNKIKNYFVLYEYKIHALGINSRITKVSEVRKTINDLDTSYGLTNEIKSLSNKVGEKITLISWKELKD